MNREEQNEFLSEHYAEAIRYMDNAKEALEKACRVGNNYTDKKYVKMACETAYSGVLIALDAWFALKGIPRPDGRQRKSIKYYMSNIAQKDKKLASDLDEAYTILHLDGYYDGITRVKTIESGFDIAYEIIERVKPETFVQVKETRARGMKRVLNNLMVFFGVTLR